MYKQALDKSLQNGQMPKSIMLYGDCDYLKEKYLEKIADFYGEKSDRQVYYFDEYDYKSAKNFISQSSLFGGLNILIIKSDKSIPKKELESLMQICQKNDSSYFILDFFGTSAKAKEISRVFSKKNGGDFVRFFKPGRYEAVSYLVEFAKQESIDIDRFALERLYELQNESLSLSAQELLKLSLLGRKISGKDVEIYSFGLGGGEVSELIEDFFRKKDIVDIIKKIEDVSAFNEVLIINMMENFISQLFKFHIYIKANGDYNSKEILGYVLPPQIARQRAELSIKIKLPVYKEIFKELSKIELVLKKSVSIDKNSFFISSLIKLQSFL